MKRLILAIFLGAVLFGISGFASWYLKGAKQASEETTAAQPQARSDKGKASALPAPETTGGVPKFVPAPAIRPQGSPDPENVVQLANNLRSQIESVKTKEQQLTVRQKNLEVIYQDLKSERGSLDELRTKVDAELKALVEKLASLEEKSADVNQQRQKLGESAKEIKQSMLEIDSVEQNRIKQMAAMYDSMEAEAAAELMQQMADSGKMDMAVKILSSMRERQAARLLSQLGDRTTTVQLLERLKTLKKPAAAP